MPHLLFWLQRLLALPLTATRLDSRQLRSASPPSYHQCTTETAHFWAWDLLALTGRELLLQFVTPQRLDARRTRGCEGGLKIEGSILSIECCPCLVVLLAQDANWAVHFTLGGRARGNRLEEQCATFRERKRRVRLATASNSHNKRHEHTRVFCEEYDGACSVSSLDRLKRPFDTVASSGRTHAPCSRQFLPSRFSVGKLSSTQLKDYWLRSCFTATYPTMLCAHAQFA